MLLTRCHHPRHNRPMNRDFQNLHNQMERLFEDFPRTWLTTRDAQGQFQPATDLVESEEDYRVILEVPGVNKDDIKLSVKDGELTISAEKKTVEGSEEDSEGQSVWRRERSFGSFSRTFSFAQRIDSSGISASYKDGVLQVTVPKAEEAKPQSIEVQVD